MNSSRLGVFGGVRTRVSFSYYDSYNDHCYNDCNGALPYKKKIVAPFQGAASKRDLPLLPLKIPLQNLLPLSPASG
jgi:hypothetical protein